MKNKSLILMFGIILIVISGFFLCSSIIFARPKVVNIYVWNDYLPQKVINQFTQETGIKVHVSEYDNNETMYAKLKAAPNAGYDIVLPSSYFIPRMRKQNMLHKIDKNKLSNFKYLDRFFLKKPFDAKNDYSIPFLWGSTGIVVNKDYFNPQSVQKWQDLWQPRFRNQLLLLDDMREVFSMALLTLGYSINDTNPKHIKEAYLKLKALLPNVKLFNADIEQSIYIDEDITIGMGWNGDINLSKMENPKLEYIYPKEGFALWIDCLAITKNAPHLANAYKFINFLLRPDIAKEVILERGFAAPNLGAIKLLPKKIRENSIINPSKKILKRSQLQTNVDQVLPLYEKYWERLKIGG